MSVSLVGAGPGDPGLLSVRAAELIRAADCVVHDDLVGPRILALVPEDVPRHDVGTRGHATSQSQAAINELLIACASRHARVVRLMGGDAFVFGHGGEEAQALAAAGIACAIVPFDNRPLSGRRVLVTRAAAQGGRLAAALEELGAEAVHAPLQRFVHHPEAAIAADDHAWIAFTSTNAVEVVFAGLARHGRDLRALAPARIAAVGPGTAEALLRHGIRADLLPEHAEAPALAETLIAAGGHSVLLPQAAEADPVLAERLRAAGWRVSTVTAYHAEALPVDVAALGQLDAIALASAATVRRLRDALGEPELARRRAAGCRIIAIGPRTAAACVELGLPADAVADAPTPEGVARAVAAALA